MGQDGRMGSEMQALEVHNGQDGKGDAGTEGPWCPAQRAGGRALCIVREGASSLQQEPGLMALCEGFLACVLGLRAYGVPRK